MARLDQACDITRLLTAAQAFEHFGCSGAAGWKSCQTVSSLRYPTKVEQVFSDFSLGMVFRPLALPNKRAYVLAVASVNADVASSPTRRKGMKMTPSNTFTIHAGSGLVRVKLQSVKRWQGFCLSKRM
tara:strand:- start:3344 stop:3727 length:384 start_codon:yes stop_codon:yes gene_type:complete